MSRPCKLTPDIQEKLILAIKGGSHLSVACAYAGINYSTFRQWIQRGEGTHKRKSDIEYVEFVEAVQKAESDVEVRLTAQWQKAAANDWRAAAEFLSRRFPERWSPSVKLKIQVEQAVDAELNLLFEALSADPSIPNDVKLKLLTAAENLSDRVEMANQN